MPEGTKKRAAATPKAAKAEVTEPEVKPEVQKCKECGSELKKLLFDSRAKEPLYLYVCDNRGCPLYRQPQKYEGDLPAGVNIAIA